MAKNTKMGERQLLAIIGDYEKSAMGNSTAQGGVSLGGPTSTQLTTLEIDRYNALNYYYARPFGNELADRSQVVIPELRDTVEWMLPQLMRMFLGSDCPVRFEPEAPGDEAQAEQATDVVNYIFMKQNDGWTILHDYFKDALLLRNGYVKIYSDTKRKIKLENYSGLSEDELALLMQPQDDEEINIISQSATPMLGMPQIPGPDGQPQPPPMQYSVKLRRISNKRAICVDCVPPEEMLVSSRAASINLDDSPFYCHRVRKPRSVLIQEGYDEDDVMALQPGAPRWTEIIQLARDSVLDEQTVDETGDPSMTEVEIHECILRVDYDGDGIAELRRVVVGGSNIKVLDNEEIEEGTIAAGAPVRMPHRHIGLSLYDLLMDVQQMKSMLTRQAFDNVYLANNSRIAIDYNKVNTDDLMTNRPGGVVRVDGPPGESVMPLASPTMVGDIIPMIEYVDSMREMRTGVGKDTVGLDPEALQNVTKAGQLAGMAAATYKIEMIARLLAEGVKEIFRKIHGEMIRHQDEPLVVQLRGQWTQVDPRSWRKRDKVSINVGLGAGTSDEKRTNLMLISQIMEKSMPLGIAGPKQAYTLATDMVQTLMGTPAEGKYFVDPDSPQGKQLQQQIQQSRPQPPQLQVAQIKAQADIQAAQIKAQSTAQQSQMDHGLQLQRLSAQSQSETQQNVLEARIAALKNQLDMARQQQKDGGQLALDQNKALLAFVADIAAAALKANATPQAIQSDVGAAAQAGRSA